MRNFVYTVLIAICIISLSGCFGGGGSGGSGLNPMAPEIVTAPIPEAPVDANIATGTATVVIRIVLSERARERQAISSIRASAQAPYVQAQLYVDDKLAYNKTVAVVNGTIEIAFSNVVNSGMARVELNFVGCHLHGATKFSGSSKISQQTVISVKPIWPEGAIVTSDGRLLREIGTAYAKYGKVFSGRNLAFNAAGNPVGYDRDGCTRDFVTGQTYFTAQSMLNPDSGPTVIAYHMGSWYTAGNETVCKVNADMSGNALFLGVMGKPGWAIDGTALPDVRLEVINDIRSANGMLYVYNSYQQIVEVGAQNIKVYTSERLTGSMSITEDGRKLMGVSVTESDSAVIEMLGGTNYRQVGPAFTNEGWPNSAISYNNGTLVGLSTRVAFIDSAGSATDWVKISYTYGVSVPRIYKSPNGKIYVTSERMGKIWEVL